MVFLARMMGISTYIQFELTVWENPRYPGGGYTGYIKSGCRLNQHHNERVMNEVSDSVWKIDEPAIDVSVFAGLCEYRLGVGW